MVPVMGADYKDNRGFSVTGKIRGFLKICVRIFSGIGAAGMRPDAHNVLSVHQPPQAQSSTRGSLLRIVVVGQVACRTHAVRASHTHLFRTYAVRWLSSRILCVSKPRNA
jgi:hypothetical protein